MQIGHMAPARVWLMAIFPASLLLLVLAAFALATEQGWLAVVALAISAVVEGILRWRPLAKGRLLRIVRDRAAQTSTLRVAMAAMLLFIVAEQETAAIVVVVGVTASLIFRILAGWLEEGAARTGQEPLIEMSGGEESESTSRIGTGVRYIRALTISELAVLVSLAVALLDQSDAWVTVLAALAWLPSVYLVARTTREWFRTRTSAEETPPVPGRVAVYFAEPSARAYQLEQWLPVFNDIHRDLGVVLMFRNRSSFERFGKITTLPRIYAEKLDHLISTYARGDHGVVLYVNNGVRNFQSLSWPHAIHVHINHGESDKTSLVTHQAKAYDRILLAGEAAVRRIEKGLLEDLPDVMIVGRPQLDYVEIPSARSATARPTLVYAPTWEGENDANNFSSVDVGGPEIIRSMLDVPNATVVYKPHPRTPTSRSAAMRAAHRTICQFLTAAAVKNPDAGHRLWDDDILPLLAQADVLVADVSSVTIDHLYLRRDASLILMDRGSSGGTVRTTEVPIAKSAEVVRADTLGDLSATISRLIGSGEQVDGRHDVCRAYFGTLEFGESTKRFQSVVTDLVWRRDELRKEPSPDAYGSDDQTRERNGQASSSAR